MSQSDQNTEQDNQGNVPEVKDPREQELELLRSANKFLSKQVEEKTDKLAKLQIATYKCTTERQYKLIQSEAGKVQLNQGIEPPSHFYFPKIGMRRCQCDVCKALAQGIRQQIAADKTLEGYTDAGLFQLTGIGHFEGHSGFNREEATYICEFLNKHPEYMYKLENLDKDRYAE